MTPAERFKKVREYLDLKQEEMANIFDFKWHKIKDIEIGKQKVSIELAELVEEKFSINGWWLLTGKGNMLIDENSKTSNVNVNNSNNILNKNGNVALNGGSININKEDYSNIEEIRELLDLLKDVPKSWIPKLIEKLKTSLNKIDDIF